MIQENNLEQIDKDIIAYTKLRKKYSKEDEELRKEYKFPKSGKDYISLEEMYTLWDKLKIFEQYGN